MRSARFRELWNLIFVALLTAIGFLSVYTARQQEIDSTSLVYAGFFFALYAVAHIGLRAGRCGRRRRERRRTRHRPATWSRSPAGGRCRR